MSEVRRHQRRTASGKTTTVKRHERGTGAAAQRRQDEWEDRAAERWTPPPRPEATETEAPDESWWDDDVPRPEAWMDHGEDEPEPEKSPRQLRREARAAECAEQRAKFEAWEADMKADAERRGLPAYRPPGTKASWWRR